VVPTIVLVLNVSAQTRMPLRLDVKVTPPDSNRVVIEAPDSKTYVGFLKNISKASLLFHVIPMAERPQGSGRYGACYLERWDPTSHQWVYVPRPLINPGSVSVSMFTLNPGQTVDVCGRPSTQELDPPGTCYRFRLQVQLKNFRSPSILSQTFKVEPQREGVAANCQP
jgi:hypothetical protein